MVRLWGAISYQEWTESPEGYTDWSTHSMCNLLQQKSFDYTCGVIQRNYRFKSRLQEYYFVRWVYTELYEQCKVS